MKKLLYATGVIGLIIIGGIAGAAMSPKEKSAAIKLYTKPSTSSKIVKAYPKVQPLIAFYCEKQWCKVGNRQDGTTGWIKMDQYQSQAGKTDQIQAPPSTDSKPHITTSTTETPYGSVKTTTQTGQTDDVTYKIVRSKLETDKMTTKQQQAYNQQITKQEQMLAQQIQHNFKETDTMV